MIKTYSTVKKEAFDRIKQKTEEQAFINFIYKNTNLSQIESQVVFEAFSKNFLDNNRKNLGEMQTKIIATKIEAPAGKKLSEADYAEVVITLHSEEDNMVRENPAEFSRKYGFGEIDSTTAVRRNKLLRITEEAYRQGCVLTQEDLAYKVFNCGLRTVQRDIAAFKRAGVHIPIRGAVCDIGRGVSHKVEAVRRFLKGEGIVDIARRLHHSAGAIERYIEKFLQVCSGFEEGLKDTEISFLTCSSFSLVKEYKELYEEIREKDKLEVLRQWIRGMKVQRLSCSKKNGRRV